MTESYSTSEETARNVFLQKILHAQSDKPDKKTFDQLVKQGHLPKDAYAKKLKIWKKNQERRPILIRLDSKTGRNLSGHIVSIAEKESEVVARKGSKFTVKSIQDKGTHHEIHLVENQHTDWTPVEHGFPY